MSIQHHFEFNEWEKAFASFYARKKQDEALCLVVSEGPYVSGYWIEPSSGAEPDSESSIYYTVKDARRLEARIRRRRNSGTSLSLGLVV